MENKLDIQDLYSVRFLLFMEDTPQSNKYRRILLTREQYKAMSAELHKQFPKDAKHHCGNPECDGTMLKVSDNLLPLPDVQDVHECITNNCKC